jgi:enoyl-CoA hydratase/carnithine racemase
VTLLTDRIPATESLRLGLVTEVVPDDLVVSRAQELADRIAGYPASGRHGVDTVWRHLRGELDDPDAWFTWLAAGNRP